MPVFPSNRNQSTDLTGLYMRPTLAFNGLRWYLMSNAGPSYTLLDLDIFNQCFVAIIDYLEQICSKKSELSKTLEKLTVYVKCK